MNNSSSSVQASSQPKQTRSSSQSKDVTNNGSAKTPTNQSLRDSLFRSGNSNDRRSPVSPSRITRLQEKEEMQNLNDRLVIYIDTVRRLESENSRLQSLVVSYNENSTRDVSEIKVLYERELEDAKRLIDELAKEKAKYEIEVNKHKSNAFEAVAKLEKREKELKLLDGKLKTFESESLEYKSRFEQAQSDKTRFQEELNTIRPQISDFEKQLQKLKKQLEDETLLRVDLENKNQTLKEDLQFKSQLYDKEIEQLRSSKRVEIEQVDVRLRDEYDSRLVSELQRIRDETEFKIKEMKDEVERRYQNKFADSDSNLKRSQLTTSSLRDELLSHKSKVEELQIDLNNLQSKLQSNEIKIRDLEEKLKKAQAKYERDMASKDEELNNVRKEMQDLLLDYQELYDVKIALDMEIAAYRKLLESEEQRLNISASVGTHSVLHGTFLNDSPSSVSVTNSSRGKKRRMGPSGDEEINLSSTTSIASQYTQSHESKGPIQIGETDFDGKFVRLINTGDKEVSIGGWQLRRVADGHETEFKFTKSCSIKPGQHINIWSSNCNAPQDSSNDFVMNNQKWFVGDKMITVLNDKDQKEQSRRESQKNLSVNVEKRLRATPNRALNDSKASTSSNNGQQSSGASSAFQKVLNLWKS